MPDDRPLTPDLLLRTYANGIFPMGDDATGTVRWYAPDPRAHLPLDAFHVPHNLRRRVRQREFEVTADQAFGAVIEACADRSRTWITPRIIRVYTALHERGYAHSVECWQDGELAGGLYGVALKGAFFGESMFYRVSNASKVALVHLVRQLRAGGFTLLDTQYSTEHLERFGVVEIPRPAFQKKLSRALDQTSTWWPLSDAEAADLDTPVSAFSAAAPVPQGNESAPSG
ncbi:MAG: leucyl/phenylalanyl-tRNA--protein transferase [Salinibacter sp.]